MDPAVFSPSAGEARSMIERLGVLPLGDHVASQAAIDDLLQSAGLRTDPEQRARDHLSNPGLLDVGWSWVDAAATTAARDHDGVTVLRAFALAFFWNEDVMERLSSTADRVAIGLGPVPTDVKRSLLGQARIWLTTMDSDAVVFGDASGAWTVELIGQWIAAAPQLGW
jgi:hypothetical protein